MHPLQHTNDFEAFGRAVFEYHTPCMVIYILPHTVLEATEVQDLKFTVVFPVVTRQNPVLYLSPWLLVVYWHHISFPCRCIPNFLLSLTLHTPDCLGKPNFPFWYDKSCWD